MSFRKKLTIIFLLVLALTVSGSIISWLGMRDALISQKQVYAFQNHIERTFYEMSTQEQAFTAEETISHSRQLLDLLAEMRSQIGLVQDAERDPQQLAQLTVVQTRLDEYEKAFSEYVQQNLEMQTLRSRMEQEAERLHHRVDDLVLRTSLVGREIEHKIIMALFLQQKYITKPAPEIRAELLATIVYANQVITAMSEQAPSENIRLLLYRIGRATDAFVAIFNQFADQQALEDVSHDNLRKGFFRLNKEFNQAVNTKTNLVNREISSLQTFLIISSSLAVLISIGAIVLLSAVISRPIARLKASALSIVGGDLNTTVRITSRDEIGELGKLFNQMTTRLRTSFAELETYRDRLEELVRYRTNELELEISERLEAEKELAASEKRFRTIFDHSTDGILITDPVSRRFVLANKTICKMLGYSEAELLRLSAEDLHPPQDLVLAMEDFERAVAGKSNFSKDIPVIRKDGSVFPMEISSTMIELGGQSLLLGCIRDITERKTMEEERLKVRKLESVGVLAGGIAHDFNNILAAVLGNVSLILALTDDSDRRYQLLKDLEKASLRARDLTMQLLTFSKGGEPVKEVTDIAEIIKESAQFILHGSNVRCDFKFADNLWNAEVDSGQISQVIQNIVVNAWHAMPDGGVITISCRNVVASSQRSELLANKNCLEIVITDNGPGIPEELLDQIFDPYFTTKKGGSGLGLAITHSIVSKHNGIISVQSLPGKGATFTVLLPAVAVEVSMKTMPVKGTIGNVVGKKVMVMDDEEAVREVTMQLLRHLGYETVLVADGQEAIETYSQHLASGSPIDLVIMDLTIPGGMGGKEAAEKILAVDPTATLVVASGYYHDPIMANYESFGFRGFLPKPYQLADLREVLLKLLGEGGTDAAHDL